MDNCYWEIELWNKDKIRVKPQNAAIVQERISKGDGFLQTADMTINVKDIKSFNKTEHAFTDQKLLEESSMAFNDPIYDDNNSIRASWVKKTISRRRWENYYHLGNYKLFESTDTNSVVIMFRIPTHLIDLTQVTPLTNSEIVTRHLI